MRKGGGGEGVDTKRAENTRSRHGGDAASAAGAVSQASLFGSQNEVRTRSAPCRNDTESRLGGRQGLGRAVGRECRDGSGASSGPANTTSGGPRGGVGGATGLMHRQPRTDACYGGCRFEDLVSNAQPPKEVAEAKEKKLTGIVLSTRRTRTRWNS